MSADYSRLLERIEDLEDRQLRTEALIAKLVSSDVDLPEQLQLNQDDYEHYVASWEDYVENFYED